MKIVQLDIQGFRSLKNVSWRPGDLNVIIGPNGSGKSNLLRMLEMISASAQGRMDRYIQEEGGIGALVWDGNAPKISFSFRASPASTLEEILPNHGVAYGIQVERVGLSGIYTIEQERLEANRGGAVYLQRTGRDKASFGTKASQKVSGSPLEKETALSFTITPFFKSDYDSRIQYLQRQLSNWSIYQHISVDRSAPVRQAPISRLEQHVDLDGQNLISVLHTLYTRDRQFKQDINDAMSAAFGTDFDELVFPPDSGDQRIQMRVRWKTLKRDQSTADLSDGTLRFLFLMTVLAAPNPPPLIAIDEPETGLHPSMLPIIAEFATEAATRTQVIFTTHSDSFLDAFRDTRPTTTVAKWENGETTLTTLDDKELAWGLQLGEAVPIRRAGEHGLVKFILFVEGDTEALAIAPFLKRWLDGELANPVGLQIVKFVGASELVKGAPERALRHLNAPKGDVLAVFALLDLYECPLPYPSHQMTADERVKWGKKHMEKKVNHPHFRQFFAVHEIEAWLLSDPLIFPAQFQNSLTAKSRQPETVNSDEPPYRLLRNLYATRTASGYRKTTEGPDLFRNLDPRTAYAKCPSLKALLDEMLLLARQAGFR